LAWQADDVNGEKVARGARRVSFTFRRVRLSQFCDCDYALQCDAARREGLAEADSRSTAADSESAEGGARSAEADAKTAEADAESAEADAKGAAADSESAEGVARNAEADAKSAEADAESAEGVQGVQGLMLVVQQS